MIVLIFLVLGSCGGVGFGDFVSVVKFLASSFDDLGVMGLGRQLVFEGIMSIPGGPGRSKMENLFLGVFSPCIEAIWFSMSSNDSFFLGLILLLVDFVLFNFLFSFPSLVDSFPASIAASIL